MKRKTPFLFISFFLISILTACGESKNEAAIELPEPATPSELQVLQSSNSENELTHASQAATEYETLVDEQGNVTVSVAPINLSNTATSLDFAVVMDTHSVELGMDLAALATISMDNGRSVSATLWDATPGGHHVSGVLSFPAWVDEVFLLDDATRLTITILDVDGPERVFTWDVVN
jgi:hypothetical protein